MEIRESMYSSSEPCAVAWLPLLPPPLPDTWANSSIMDSGFIAAASVPRFVSARSRIAVSSSPAPGGNFPMRKGWPYVAMNSPQSRTA